MQVTVISNDRRKIGLEVDKFPDECPYCHRGIEANFLYGYLNESKYLDLSFFCPRTDCQNHFVGRYDWNIYNNIYLKHVYLGRQKTKEFSDIIKDISKDFIEIYQQAEIAEENGLTQICGVGYRKALEFLIKDYIISKDASLKDEVEKSLLGKCINDHIKDERIKGIAKRATWLGNDETHYIRKWIDKNVSDLKILIDLTVHWIETEALTDKMISLMPE